MKSREIRLGLVMYGGVSLAIYINGVAHEFFRAVRGNGVYKWLKALTDSDIIVDVISGSSAGGMNGILLAYALCNNKDFAAAAELWRRDGDIRSLLRVPDGAAPNTRSLLDSQGYYQPRLEEAFRFMIDYEPRDDHEKGFNTRVKELDLFVTGTDVDGNIATVFDDAGHPIDVKDHRAVFLLKHRQGRKQPFDPKFDPKVAQAVTYEALAKLARITSCFPAAFEPVTISYRKPRPDDLPTANDLLRDWGRLGKETTFLDGGVIDNKPFTHTLREIFGRAATRQVERILFYVEPDPEFFQQRAQASQPNFLQTILSALVGIPGYESISDDLKLLSNRNRKLNQYRRLLATPGQDVPTPDLHRRSRLIVLSDRVVQGILREDGRDVHLADPEQRKIGAALFAEFDRIYGGSADGNEERRAEVRERQQKQAKTILYNFDIYFRLRRLRYLVYKIYDLLYPTAQEPSSGQPAPSAAQPANSQPASSAAQPANGQPESDKAARKLLQDLWQTLNWRIEVLEIIAARMEKMLDDTDFKWQEKGREAATTFADEKEAATEVARQIWREVDERMRGVLAAIAPRDHLIELHDAILQMEHAAREADADEQTSPGLNKIKEAFRKFYEKLKQGSPEESPSPDGLLLRFTDDQEKELFEAFAARFEQTVPDCDLKKAINALRQDYKDFEAIDARRLPLELMGDLFEKDHIETIRISPADADKGFSNKGLSDKVAGDALYHFASFFKRSWRANDILWGRLDGLCQIVETLLKDKAIASPARLREFFFKGGEPNQGWEPAMEPEYLFPNAGRRTHDALRSWIENLAANEEEKNKAARAEDSLTDNVKLLIEAAQLEVLHADAPTVINDALAEQARWNQFRAPRAEAAQPRAGQAPQPAVEPGDRFAFHPADGSLDQFVGAVAAAAQSFTNTKNLKGDDDDAPRPIFTRLGKFFRQEYRVGNEQLLRDLPQPVLLEILAVTLLVMRNCILDVFGANAGKVKASWLYRFGVDFPLRAFYGAALFMRRAPRDRLTHTLYGIFALSALALSAGIIWWNPIVQAADGQFHRWRFLCFILLPAIAFGGILLFLARYKFERRRQPRGAWRRFLNLLRRLLSVLWAAFKVAVPILAVTAFLALMSRLPFRRFTEFQAAVAAEFDIPVWVAGVLLSLALIGFCLVSYVVFRIARLVYHWLAPPARLTEKQLRAALHDYFDIEEIKLLARRLGMKAASRLKGEEKEKAIEEHEKEMAKWEWVSPEQLKSRLACAYLPAWQVKLLIDQLPLQLDDDKKKKVDWNDAQKALESFGAQLRSRAVPSHNGGFLPDGGEWISWRDLPDWLQELRRSDRPREPLLEPRQVDLLLAQLRAGQKKSVGRTALKAEQKKEVRLDAVWQAMDRLGEEMFDHTDWQALADRLRLKEQLADKLFAWIKNSSGKLTMDEVAGAMRALNPEALR